MDLEKFGEDSKGAQSEYKIAKSQTNKHGHGPGHFPRPLADRLFALWIGFPEAARITAKCLRRGRAETLRQGGGTLAIILKAGN